MHINKKSKGNSAQRVARWKEQHPIEKTVMWGSRGGVGYDKQRAKGLSFKLVYGRLPRRMREKQMREAA